MGIILLVLLLALILGGLGFAIHILWWIALVVLVVWLVGVLVQTCTYGSAAGFSKATWPDGSSVAAASTAVVHHQTDTYITTYTATDPPRSTSGRVALDGFFGWPLTATAS